MVDRTRPHLCAVLGATLREETRSESAATAALLESMGPGILSTSQPDTAWHPAMRELLASSNHSTARACRTGFNLIPWGHNPVAARMSEVGDILMVAPMVGPDGPVPSTRYRMGLYYQRPNTYYQLHSHAAAETYFIIAGSAVWTAGDDTRLRTAGSIIHHPTYMPHAFRSGPLGFFAIWRWSGDIRTETYSLVQDDKAGEAF